MSSMLCDTVLLPPEGTYNKDDEDDDRSLAMDRVNDGGSISSSSKLDSDDMEDDEWTATVSRNVEHLQLMVAKDYWTSEDMTAANAAIAANT